MRVNVNIQLDFSLGVCSHLFWLPPEVPVPVPVPSIEVPAIQFWLPGFFLHEFSDKGGKPVMHKYQYIVLDDHDCGILIPDLTIPVVNAYYPLQWPASSRKIVFSASTVKMSGAPTCCAQWIGLPPLPMLTCGKPFSLPVAWSMITITNTVIVGMTFKDFLKGLFNIAKSIAIDFILGKIFPVKPPGKFLKEAAIAIAKILGKYLFKEAKKKVLSELSGFSTKALANNPTAAASPPASAPAASSSAPSGQGGSAGPGSALGSMSTWGTPPGGSR